MVKVGLRGSISLFVLVGLGLGLGLFIWVGVQALNESTRRTLDERLTMDRLVSEFVDETLRGALGGVRESARPCMRALSTDFEATASGIRHTLGRGNLAPRGVYLVDKEGRTLLADSPFGGPPPDFSSLSSMVLALKRGQPTIPGLVSGVDSTTGVLFITPVTDEQGVMAGGLVVLVDVARSSISGFVQPLTLGKTGYAELVDGQGIVLARTDPGQPPALFEMSDHPDKFAALIKEGKPTVGTCHRCHTAPDVMERRRELLAFSPLTP